VAGARTSGPSQRSVPRATGTGDLLWFHDSTPGLITRAWYQCVGRAPPRHDGRSSRRPPWPGNIPTSAATPREGRCLCGPVRDRFVTTSAKRASAWPGWRRDLKRDRRRRSHDGAYRGPYALEGAASRRGAARPGGGAALAAWRLLLRAPAALPPLIQARILSLQEPDA